MSIMLLKDFKMDKTFLCSSSQKNRENSHSKGEEYKGTDRHKIGWFKKLMYCSQWRSICEHSCDCLED